MGDEVRRARQAAFEDRRADVASPTLEATGQLAGFSANTFSVHAFCSVFNGDGSCLGSETFTRHVRLRAPAARRQVSFTCRLVPSTREVFALVETLNSGLNFSAAQLVTWNGAATLAFAPSVLSISPVTFIGSQLVGLNTNPDG